MGGEEEKTRSLKLDEQVCAGGRVTPHRYPILVLRSPSSQEPSCCGTEAIDLCG